VYPIFIGTLFNEFRHCTLRYVNISTIRNDRIDYPIYSNFITVLLNFRITQDDMLTYRQGMHKINTFSLMYTLANVREAAKRELM
jgi:hypothetical protein